MAHRPTNPTQYRVRLCPPRATGSFLGPGRPGSGLVLRMLWPGGWSTDQQDACRDGAQACPQGGDGGDRRGPRLGAGGWHGAQARGRGNQAGEGRSIRGQGPRGSEVSRFDMSPTEVGGWPGYLWAGRGCSGETDRRPNVEKRRLYLCRVHALFTQRPGAARCPWHPARAASSRTPSQHRAGGPLPTFLPTFISGSS